MPDLHIFVAECASKSWPRFVIRNNRNQLWTGDSWTEKPQDALLFNSGEEALAKVTELTLASTERLVVTTVAIRVDREKPFSIAELQEYLATSFRGLLLDGDFSGATFQVEPDWDELREIE
ncbi:hypothetical protein ETAA8_46610 [Anatilimnocola aggregata]|uniref:Uncharacterized protein n=1 Tax=Anatilimnocola aggregata TaxID=2528021 RepID=A0A517YH45_9BACT|nr:hypothetical protein [Anatilimnocola aggregata]QDU29547.1 hypothetical protein ETAA8_46610 [Anatilimnocola aggregata]